MKTILILGAGRSSFCLIEHLLDYAVGNQYKVRIGDADLKLAQEKAGGHPSADTFHFIAENESARIKEIEAAEIVISMLPPALHIMIAKDCLTLKKNLVTASYLSPELRAMDSEVKHAGLIFLNEMGLDPGIDHLSAMKVINDVKLNGGELLSFKSFAGGLIDDKADDENPWRYKFTWNPRNVVLAGQNTARYLENNRIKYVPYHRLFAEAGRVEVEGEGSFDAYPNRDSMAYRELYGLQNVETLLRGTLRRAGFCKAWNALVKIGLTDDSVQFQGDEELAWDLFLQSFLPEGNTSAQSKVAALCGLELSDDVMQKLTWLGIFSNQPIGRSQISPASILQHLLESKWKLKNSDVDLVVMQHEFIYVLHKEKYKHLSSLIVKGSDSNRTAMAKTVGLPLAMAAIMILENKITKRGVIIPLESEIYEPLLAELDIHGISIKETKSRID